MELLWNVSNFYTFLFLILSFIFRYVFFSWTVLWKRLKVNPEWKIPIDEFVEEFIWRVLISLDHVDWYELKEPRVSPPVFASTEEYLQAADSREIDVCFCRTYTNGYD